MDKNDKDIRKEIEELEKLIEQVRKQNEEDKQKQKKNLGPRGPVVIKINLGMEYSRNIYVNLLISFVVNFLIIFGLFNLINFAYIADSIYIVLIALILTFYEELLRRYLVKNFMSIVVFSSGLIFFLMNLILFYFIDLVIFRDHFYFNSHWDPIIFVMFLHFIRTIIKVVYISFIKQMNFRRIKRRR
ncbi:MAG TPA: hypothetical protein PLB83_00445 [Bacillota bacterium]|nr:hypothetical protein [Bacillota bacterium]